jgi:hypothetical protein
MLKYNIMKRKRWVHLFVGATHFESNASQRTRTTVPPLLVGRTLPSYKVCMCVCMYVLHRDLQLSIVLQQQCTSDKLVANYSLETISY